MSRVFVSGGFDNLRSRHVRFLHEASRLGEVTVLLWSDLVIDRLIGVRPRFQQEERRYILEALRHVRGVVLSEEIHDADTPLFPPGSEGGCWVVPSGEDTPRKRDWCRSHTLEYRSLPEGLLSGWPVRDFGNEAAVGQKKVIATGCYDWFHSGHIRFFEEASQLGLLFVAIGHDANVRLLKGEGHPMFPQEERRYLVDSVRHVTGSLITSGTGWMDAEPEIERLKPDIYVVNEDGDVPEKRAFCDRRGITYVVLKRLPKAGLPRRQSADLRLAAF